MLSLHRKPFGFTLLEIVLAMAVLALALLALLTLRNRDVALQAHARHLVSATALAQHKLEELIVSAEARDAGQPGDVGERYPGYRWDWTIEPSPLDGWLELRVEVNWPEGSRRERVELVGYAKSS
jgi:general secretion pathway protein I